MKQNSIKFRRGRPSIFTTELGDEICRTIAVSTKSLRTLCKENNWPNANTICEWRIKNKHFGELYARAKKNQIEALVDKILLIADDTTNDYILGKNGKYYVNYEHIKRVRLRIDTLKWLASKLCPRIWQTCANQFYY